MNENIDEIKHLLDSFEIDKARELLRDALKNNPTAETYYVAAKAALNDQQRITFLEKALELDPFHKEAGAELERLKKPQTQSAPPTASGILPLSSTKKSDLLQEATRRFFHNEWRTTMDTTHMVRLEKRKGSNKWAEIALVVILNGLGLIIVLIARYGRKPAVVTLESQPNGLQVVGENLFTVITDAAQVYSIAESVKTSINIWIIVAIWIVREIIVYAAVYS